MVMMMPAADEESGGHGHAPVDHGHGHHGHGNDVSPGNMNLRSGESHAAEIGVLIPSHDTRVSSLTMMYMLAMLN